LFIFILNSNIETLGNLKELNIYNNQLTLLEGMENFVNLIKNNEKIIKGLYYDFIDSNDFTELNYLFCNLLICNNKIDDYIEKIEKMIIELNGFQKYVLK
jgi:hypothetical protein